VKFKGEAMKKVVIFLLLLLFVLSFSEITIQNIFNNAEVSGTIVYKWIENKNVLKDISYWELYCNNNFIAKTTKMYYEWNPESESYPKTDGWYNIVIKGFGSKGKIIDESGINVYIKHHKLVLRLLERSQTVGNTIRFKIASINIYNGVDFPIIDRAQIQLYSPCGSFSLNETDWSTITSIFMEPGHTESRIIYYRSFKAGYRKIAVSREYWGRSSATVYYSPLSISGIEASSDIYYISGNPYSNKIVLSLKDKYGNPVSPKEDQKLYLYFSDKNGTLSTDRIHWNENFITLRKGNSRVELYYKNSTAEYEDSTIVLTHPGWNNLLLNIHIRKKPAILRLILNKDKVDLNEIVYGRISVLDSNSKDSFFTEPKTINVYSTSKKGYFATNDGWYPSMKFTIPPFSFVSQSFYYKDSSVGTQTLTIKSNLKSTNYKIGVANDVVKLSCVECAKNTVAGSSVKFIIRTVNKYDIPVAAPSKTKLLLKVSNGGFYKTKDLSNKISSIVFPTNSSSIDVYYYNTKSGKDGIAIYEYPDKGWKNIYGEMKILPTTVNTINAPSLVKTEANKFSDPIKFKITDKYGNTCESSNGYDVILTSDSSTTIFDRSSFHISSSQGTFKVKDSRIGKFHIMLKIKSGNKEISKKLLVISKGYLTLENGNNVNITAGIPETVNAYFTDSSKKRIESIKPIEITPMDSSKKLIFTSIPSKKGYVLKINSNKTGKYFIKFESNDIIIGNLSINILVKPAKLETIKVTPDNMPNKLKINGKSLKFEIKISDKYKNPLYPYSLRLFSKIGKFYDSFQKEINIINFKKDTGSIFYFKPTDFGTSSIEITDPKTGMKKSINISTEATLTTSIPSTSTIMKLIPIKISMIDKNGKEVKVLKNIKISLDSNSGNFFANNSIVNSITIPAGSFESIVYYKTTKPGTSILTFKALGKKIEKIIHIKDTPILTKFTLSPAPTNIVAGKTVVLKLTAYDQHGKIMILSKALEVKIDGSEDLSLFEKEKKISKSFEFTKGASSIKISLRSNIAGKDNITLSISKYPKINYKFTIIPAQADKITVVTKDAKHSYKIYIKSSPIKIEFQDKFGNLTTPSTAVFVSLKSENNAEFLNFDGKKIKGVLTKKATEFYLMPTKKGTDTISVNCKDLKSSIFKIYAQTYPYTLKIKSVPPFSEGEISKAVKILLVDKNYETILASTDISVKLKTNSNSGKFFDKNKNPVNGINISRGSDFSYFYYTDSTLGDHKITLISSPTLESTSIILSTVKPVKNIEFRNVDQKFESNKIYKLSIVTVNEDGIQWYVGDGATIKITSPSTQVLFSTDGKNWNKSLILNIKPYSSSVSFKIRASQSSYIELNALWIERKVSAKIKLFFKGEK
jgi:hypothetical protein